MMKIEPHPECKDCRHCRFDAEENVYFCRRSYTTIDPEQSACDDFEEDHEDY